MNFEQQLSYLVAIAQSMPRPVKGNFLHQVNEREVFVPDGASFDYIKLAHELNRTKLEELKGKEGNLLESMYTEVISNARYLEEQLILLLQEQ